MNIKTVLFDLDGTLLPMDQDTFVKAITTINQGRYRWNVIVGYHSLFKNWWFALAV